MTIEPSALMNRERRAFAVTDSFLPAPTLVQERASRDVTLV